MFWPPASRNCIAKVNPTLDEVRGRVVVLQDFDGESGEPWRKCDGIPYPNAFSVQDEWKLSSNWELYGKWEAIPFFLWGWSLRFPFFRKVFRP